MLWEHCRRLVVSLDVFLSHGMVQDVISVVEVDIRVVEEEDEQVELR